MPVYILALDPSFRNTGWAILELLSDSVCVKDVGVITTKKCDSKLKIYAADDNHRCAQQIARELTTVIHAYRPKLVCAESQSGSKNSRAAQLMGMGWGVISAICVRDDLPVLQATPVAIKKANTGSAKASKDDIEEAVKKKFSDAEGKVSQIFPKGLREHVYDAISVFVACESSTELHVLKELVQSE